MTREEQVDWLCRLKADLNNGVIFTPWNKEFTEALNKALEQEPCEDEYIKVPKKALKYRTAGMVAYNTEWLKNHFDLERAVICGDQGPCENAISRQIISDYVGSHIQEINTGYGDLNKHTNEILRMIVDYIGSMPPVTPQSKTGHWVPVSERLPEEEGNYLVTFGTFAETINGEKVIFGDIDGSVSEIGYGCYGRDIFGHSTAFGWYDLDTATPFDKRAIIAWMPLPQPYKVESEG